MSSDNGLTGNELTINDANLNAIRAYFDEVVDSTQQWIAYAQANANDPQAVQEASLAIQQGVEEIKAHAVLTTEALGKAVRLIGGLQAANEELADQRDDIAAKHDEVVTELNTVRAEMEETKQEAYSEGYSDGQEEYEIDPYWMEDIISEEVAERERGLFDDVQHIASQLRQMGEAHDADELEAALGLSAEMREKAQELLSRAQMIVWNRTMLEDDEPIEDEEDAEVDAA